VFARHRVDAGAWTSFFLRRSRAAQPGPPHRRSAVPLIHGPTFSPTTDASARRRGACWRRPRARPGYLQDGRTHSARHGRGQPWGRNFFRAWRTGCGGFVVLGRPNTWRSNLRDPTCWASTPNASLNSDTPFSRLGHHGRGPVKTRVRRGHRPEQKVRAADALRMMTICGGLHELRRRQRKGRSEVGPRAGRNLAILVGRPSGTCDSRRIKEIQGPRTGRGGQVVSAARAVARHGRRGGGRSLFSFPKTCWRAEYWTAKTPAPEKARRRPGYRGHEPATLSAEKYKGASPSAIADEVGRSGDRARARRRPARTTGRSW